MCDWPGNSKLGSCKHEILKHAYAKLMSSSRVLHKHTGLSMEAVLLSAHKLPRAPLTDRHTSVFISIKLPHIITPAADRRISLLKHHPSRSPRPEWKQHSPARRTETQEKKKRSGQHQTRPDQKQKSGRQKLTNKPFVIGSGVLAWVWNTLKIP